MGKSKSKHKNKKSDEKGGFLSTNVKRASTVLVAALIGELVEAAAERLLRRFSNSSSRDHHDGILNSGSDGIKQVAGDAEGVVKGATVQLQDKVEGVSPALKEAIEVIRSSAKEIAPHLVEVLSDLKALPHRSLQQSTDAIGGTTELAMDGVTGTVRNFMDAIDPAGDNPGDKKGRKKGKKKHKE